MDRTVEVASLLASCMAGPQQACSHITLRDFENLAHKVKVSFQPHLNSQPRSVRDPEYEKSFLVEEKK